MKVLLLLVSISFTLNAFAMDEFHFDRSFSTYKQALINSTDNNKKITFKTECITKNIFAPNEFNNQYNEIISTQSYEEEYYHFVNDDIVTIISSYKNEDTNLPNNRSETEYNLKTDNLLIVTATSSSFYKGENGETKIVKNNFYIEKSLKNGQIDKVLKYQINGKDTPHHWDKHEIKHDPFGVKTTYITIDNDPSKRQQPEGENEVMLPIYNINTCTSTRQGVKSYKELYGDYLIGTWKDKNLDFELTIKDNGRFASSNNDMRIGSWEIQADYLVLTSHKNNYFKIKFGDFNSLELTHDFKTGDINKDDFGTFELTK